MQYRFTQTILHSRAICDNRELLAKRDAMQKEIGILVEMAQNAVERNARVAQDQEKYQKQYDELINRDKAASLGVSPREVELALQSAFGSREVSTIYAPTDSYSVIMELLPEYRRDPSALSLLHVRTGDGRLAPLDTLVDTTTGVGPLSVNHSGQLPSVVKA